MTEFNEFALEQIYRSATRLCGMAEKSSVIPAQAGIQIRLSDQAGSKTVLINELDSGFRRNDGGFIEQIYPAPTRLCGMTGLELL